uniref:Uncharacterized protein n=1 Tax=viral metagenome TaxID=1070528 RepID=A0A6C0I6R7_9ZZZZ
MSFASEASKLLTNKYFLYFIVFLAVSNILGYVVSNKINAVIFFVLICLITTYFSKNMVVVLIVAIIATNLLMVNGIMREGLEMATTPAASSHDVETEEEKAAKAKATPAAPATSETTTTPPATSETTTTTTPAASATTAATSGTTAEKPPLDEGFAPAGVGASGKKRGAIGGPAKPSRIDYATTLEDAYDNLDKILGSGGMQNLSADTEKLMSQQQTLFKAMNTMMPLVTNAQDMLKGLDMGKISQMVDITKNFGQVNKK